MKNQPKSTDEKPFMVFDFARGYVKGPGYPVEAERGQLMPWQTK